VVVEHPVLVAKRAYDREKAARWRKANPERYAKQRVKDEKAFRLKHPDKMKAKRKKYYAKHKEQFNESSNARYARTKDAVCEKQKEYRENNRAAILERIRRYRRSKRADPLFRLQNILRSRLNGVLRERRKVGSAVRDLGCSVDDLRAMLEAQWRPGWSWENYGTDWQIDHYFPMACANLEDRAELLAVVNYRNLRALSRQENADKSDSVCAIAQHLFNGLVREFRAAAE
jgi:hypothetical protein